MLERTMRDYLDARYTMDVNNKASKTYRGQDNHRRLGATTPEVLGKSKIENTTII